MFSSCTLLSLLLFLVSEVLTASSQNTDRFNYRATRGNDYGPEDWKRVRCQTLGECEGWPDEFEARVGWNYKRNHCQWCPAEGRRRNCGEHHQSPIDLQRNRAIETDPNFNFCIDVHWMKYHDSSCTFDELKKNNAFTIERHALKITQPIKFSEKLKTYVNGCHTPGIGRRWGKIDFSKGYTEWWHLSHIDVHLPSEHTQEGKRYDGEIQLHHHYSVNDQNELATVAVFIQAYEDSKDSSRINRLICQWRRYEDETRKACGLPSVEKAYYPGCSNPTRGHPPLQTGGSTDNSTLAPTKDSTSNSTSAQTEDSTGNSTRRHLRREASLPRQIIEPRPQPLSAYDVIHRAWEKQSLSLNNTYEPVRFDMEALDIEVADIDWDAFIEEQYLREEEEGQVTDEDHGHHRHLINYDNVPWHNYFALMDCRTEYYFRYDGSQTVPPCYGTFIPNRRKRGDNNWRVMKDPIQISKRQLYELHRLLKERIAPLGGPRACQKDTAAKPDENGDPDKIHVARPLMYYHRAHKKVFCECENWPSKFKEDRSWCRIHSKWERFYRHPYNYETKGF